MKRIIIIAVLLNACAIHSFAQKRSLLSHPFESEIRSGPVHVFLEELNARSGVRIEYASNSIDTSYAIVLAGNETTVGGLLRTILKGQYVKLLEKNKKLLLVRSSTMIRTESLVPAYSYFGFVKEAGSKEPLIGATVAVRGTNNIIATNSYGYFSLNLPEGKHRIEVSYVGFNISVAEVILNENLRADFELSVRQEGAVMQEVILPVSEVTGSGAHRILKPQAEAFNHLLGENDPLRDAYLLPGVKNIPSSFNGMFVRGGSSDENLFLLDGNVVFNPTHMLGALSIVNQTSVKAMRLFKSDFPSKYGGAISSVMDVYTKDGNMGKWQGEANVGSLAGSFTLEGPLVKNKTAVMGSFRHSWMMPGINIYKNGIKPDFYDAHFKLTQVLNKNNKVIVNLYTGQDDVRQSGNNSDNLHKWGNLLGALSWNKLIGSRSFVNTSVNMSRYDNLSGFKYTLYDDDDDDDDDDDEEDEEIETGSVGTFSSIKQYNFKSNAEIYLNKRSKLNAGIKAAHTIIKPFETRLSEELEDDEDSFRSFKPLPFDDFAAYLEAEIKGGKKFFVRPGLHFSVYRFRDDFFWSFQPRLFASYKIDQRQQLHGSFNRMTQFLHLVTNPYLGMNADIWVPSTEKLKPEESYSINLGYAFNHKSGIKFSMEGYWKELSNVTNYSEGKSFFINNENWEQNVSTGKGWAYGMETLLQKNNGDLTFLASYTLAWSWRKFADVNEGEKFPFKFDRRHGVNTGIGYKITKSFDISALWSFSTGDAFSLPDQVYPDFDNAQHITNPEDHLSDYRFIYHSKQNNQYRTGDYHRLDAGLKFHTEKIKNIRLSITGGVYNIYGAADQYIYDLKGSMKDKNLIQESGIKTFDITPYLSVNVKF